MLLKTRFKDINALRAVLPELGLEWLEGQPRFRSFTDGICVHAIGVKDNPQAYQIGVVPNKEGSWNLMFDEYAGGQGLIEKIGAQAAKLRASYGLEVARKDALRHGFSVRQVLSSNGRPALELRKNVDW